MSSSPLSIRSETVADAKVIRRVISTAFERTGEGDLVCTLRSAGALSLSQVAEIDNVVVGHVAVSPVTINGSTDPAWFGLGPIAVHPTHQRRGIGASLMVKALRVTAAMDGQGMVVLCDPAYYARFGFQPASDFGLAWEHGGGAAFQAVRLGAAEVPSGTVKYHAAFDAV